MKIQRLFLRNVRSIKSLDLDFRNPMTGKPMSRIVLIGANGSGKTTILDTLYRLVGACGASSGEEELNWVWALKQSRARAQVVLDGYCTGQNYEGLESSYYVGDQPIVEEKGLLRFDLPLIDPYERFNPELEYKSGNLVYLPQERDLIPVIFDQLTAEEEIFQPAYKYENRSKWAGSIESYIVWQNYLDLEDLSKGKPSYRFKWIVSLINDILADKEIVGVERGRVVVATQSGEKHGLNELSSGEKQLALLLVEIQRRILDKGSVILIDEPEISLHPAWQRGLVVALDKIIEQYDAQVFMATHSLEVASMVMPHEVISLNDLGIPLGKWEPEKELLP